MIMVLTLTKISRIILVNVNQKIALVILLERDRDGG